MLSGRQRELFERFWTVFAYGRGKPEAADVWLDLGKISPAGFETLLCCAAQTAAQRRAQAMCGQRPRTAAEWLAGWKR